MGLLRRILSGSDHRKTRFHSEKGQFLDAAGLPYAACSLWTAGVKTLTGKRPEKPMISWRGCRAIEAFLKPDHRVIEFGSGLSTLWYARRCAWLMSIEDLPQWHEIVTDKLSAAGQDHVRYELRTEATYANLDDIEDASIDFIMIDGTDRTGCVAAAARVIKPGGAIYLDNSDKDFGRGEGDLFRADADLRALAQARGADITVFTDFSPANFFVEEGIMVTFPKS